MRWASISRVFAAAEPYGCLNDCANYLNADKETLTYGFYDSVHGEHNVYHNPTTHNQENTVKAKILATAALLSIQAAYAGPPDARVEEYVYSYGGKQYYFMTASDSEKAMLAQPGYSSSMFVKSGRSFSAWSPSAVDRPVSAVPVARFLVPSSSSHVYVNDAAAAQLRAMPQTYVYEGIAFYAEPASSAGACPAGQKAVYSASDNRGDINYRYSTDAYEQAAMVNSGFGNDGVAFCSDSVGVDLHQEYAVGTPRTGDGKTTLTGVITAASGYDLMVGNQPVDLRNARMENSSLAGLTVGAEVTVEGALIDGTIVASDVNRTNGIGNDVTDLEGYVTAATSLSMVYVNGMVVDLSRVTAVIPTVGSRITVTGVLSNGVFTAMTLATAAAYSGSGDDALRGMSSADGLEIQGTIASYAGIDSFTVNGQLVNAANAIFEHGTAVALANGMFVDLHGNLVSGVFVATRIDVKSTAYTSGASCGGSDRSAQSAAALCGGDQGNQGADRQLGGQDGERGLQAGTVESNSNESNDIRSQSRG